MVKPRHSSVSAIFLLVAAGLLASGCDSHKAAPPRAAPATPAPQPALPPTPPAVVAPLPDWKADPATLERLAPYYRIEGYELRPPASWVIADATSVGAKILAWTGPDRDDGPGPLFCVITEAPPPQHEKEIREATLDTIMDQAASQLPKAFSNVQCIGASKRSGKVNGIPFMRADFTLRHGARDLRAVLLAGKDGSTVLAMWFIDAPSTYEETVKLGEAAMLTFRRKQ